MFDRNGAFIDRETKKDGMQGEVYIFLTNMVHLSTRCERSKSRCEFFFDPSGAFVDHETN